MGGEEGEDFDGSESMVFEDGGGFAYVECMVVGDRGWGTWLLVMVVEML